MGDQAQQVQGIGVMGLEAQNLAINLFGLLQLTGLMELDRPLKSFRSR
jgi:hypothetical protein